MVPVKMDESLVMYHFGASTFDCCLVILYYMFE